MPTDLQHIFVNRLLLISKRVWILLKILGGLRCLLGFCLLTFLWCLAACMLHVGKPSPNQHSLFFIRESLFSFYESHGESEVLFENFSFQTWLMLDNGFKCHQVPGRPSTYRQSTFCLCKKSATKGLLPMLDLPPAFAEIAPQPPAFSLVKQQNDWREL